ncbi:MAG: TonB-dependent receptor domain-containing protein [Vicinamibacteraceae bacterium]
MHTRRIRIARSAWRAAGWLALALVVVAPATVIAQVLYGSVVGAVTDTSGAVIPGAIVTITHQERNVTREEVTDAEGNYAFSTVATGTYTVRVALEGFQTVERENVQVTLNTVARINMKLGVSAVAETVMVVAQTPLLQTDRAEVRSEITATDLENLPVPLGRNYQQAFKYLPGFTPPSDAHSVATNPSRALAFNVNGASYSSNNTRIDGVSTQNVMFPHVAAYVPALESVETVNVVTSSFDAEQGLAGGSAINVQIKSGTNQLQGSAFEYHHNEDLRGRDYFAPPDSERGNFSYNQFGGTLGGPIARDKLFFFASYENTLDRRTEELTATVPTEPLRRGDLSASPTPIYDPLTGNPDGSGRSPFPNNQIPAGRIDPTAQWIIDRVPLPNLPGETNNYFVQAPFTFDRWTFDGKVDWRVNNRLETFVRFSKLDFAAENTTIFGDELQGPGIADEADAGTGSGHTYNVSVGATYTATPNFVVDANIGWVQMKTAAEMSNIATLVGRDVLHLPGTNGTRAFEGSTPSFFVDDYTEYGVSEIFNPYYRDDGQVQYVVNATWVKGTHSLRFGGDIGVQRTDHIQASIGGSLGLGARGGFEFGPGPTEIAGGPSGNNFNSWGTFLLGLPTRTGRDYLLEAPYTSRNQLYSFFVRDQWQIGPTVTLSLGTRWEYFPIPRRANRGLERYNPETNMMELGGIGPVPMDLGVEASKTMFAPRVGVAWRPTEEVVVRAGYGLTNDPFPLSRPLTRNFPVVLSMAVQAENQYQFASPLRDGIPPTVIPDLSSGQVEVPGNTALISLPEEFERGRVHSWNVTVQRALGLGFVGEVGYVGSRQSNLLGYRETNWSPIGGGRAGRQLFAEFGRDASTRVVEPVGDTSYHSLQTRVERRFADGFQLQANYTFSRAMGIAGNDNSDGSPRISIPEYFHLNRALTDFDRTHVLHLIGVAELPFGRGRRWLHEGGILPAIVGGWQMNNAISVSSGTPFTVTASDTSLDAPGSDQMADQVTSDVEILHGIGEGQAWFDPLAFAPVTEARFGNAGFNTMRGPGYVNWDLGIFRVVPLGGRRTLELRFEAFNVLNTAHFENPGDDVSNLILNPDGSVDDLNGFAEVTSAYGERIMRLGVRFAF